MDRREPDTGEGEPPLFGVVDTIGEAPRPEPHDLLFGLRTTWVGNCSRLAREAFAHVAATPDGATTIELGPDGLLTRTIEEFQESVAVFGVARPIVSDSCRRRIATALEVICDEPAAYSWTLAGLRGTTELLCRCLPEEHGRRLGRRIGRVANLLHPASIATCSSWIHYAYSAACESCWPAIGWPVQDQSSLFSPSPIETHRRIDWRRESFERRNNQWVSPADLWVAPPYDLRWIVTDKRSLLLREDHERPRCHFSSDEEGGVR